MLYYHVYTCTIYRPNRHVACKLNLCNKSKHSNTKIHKPNFFITDLTGFLRCITSLGYRKEIYIFVCFNNHCETYFVKLYFFTRQMLHY